MANERRATFLREVADHAVSVRRRRRAHRRRPDAFTLQGVRLALGDWATPQIRHAIYEGFYEYQERAVLDRTLEPGDRYLEVGVGAGFVTTAAARIVGSENVVGFDADPRIVAVARQTLRANGVAPVLTHAALMAEAGRATFYLSDEFWVSSLRPSPDRAAIEIDVLARDEEIAKHGANYVMLDIEGGETELLAAPLPGSVTKLCFECHPAGPHDLSLAGTISGLLAQGFALDVFSSVPPVLFFSR